MALLYLWSLSLQSQSVLNLIILGVSLTIIYIPCVFGMFYWKRATAAGAAWSMGAGLIAATVAFVGVSLVTSNASIMAMQQAYAEILGQTAPQMANE